jgi:hypothetical protein
MHPVTGMLGQVAGGVIIIFLLSLLWERLALRHFMSDPLKRKLGSVVAAWLTGSAIAGFGMADGGPYAWWAFGLYLVPAIIVGLVAYARAIKVRQEEAGFESS